MDNTALQRTGRAERPLCFQRGSVPGRPLNADPVLWKIGLQGENVTTTFRLVCTWAVFACSCIATNALAAPELYGSDTNFTSSTLVKIDAATSQFQTVGSFSFNVQGLAYAADLDQLFGLSAQTRRVYRIDRTTAATIAIGVAPHTYGNANGLAYDSRRRRLIASSNLETGSNNQLFTIDPATGAYGLLSTISGATNVEGLGYDPETDTLYGLADQENRIVSIDPLTGIATTFAQLPSLNWRGLEYDQFRQVFYATVSFGGDFYEITRTANPSVRFSGKTSPGTQGLALVPEPSSFALLGIAGALCARRSGRARKRVEREKGVGSLFGFDIALSGYFLKVFCVTVSEREKGVGSLFGFDIALSGYFLKVFCVTFSEKKRGRSQ